jgi:hypothetical protein
MVLLGFADDDTRDPLFRERPFLNEAEHVVWSVPPQAAAGLIDRASDWIETSSPSDD